MGDFNPDNYNDNFVADLVQFVAGDEFQTLFEKFFITYAIEFDYGEEQKLRYYEIYQEFHAMFEKQLDEFCTVKDISQGEFMKMCRSATTKDEKAKHYIDILLSSVEYETFIKLMHIMRPVAEKRLSMAESKEAEPTDEDRFAGGAKSGGAGSKGNGSSSSGSKGEEEGEEMQDFSRPNEAAEAKEDYADDGGGEKTYEDSK